jgi:sigma-B regulation protein RsbU (phosphoserine phosphatase)
MTIIINRADKSTAIRFLNNILSLLYKEGEVSLGEGNCVLFYSDRLVEAHDPKGKMFGFPRLRALVAQHGEKRLLGDLLLEELYSFVGEGWEQEDDITLLTLECSASLI